VSILFLNATKLDADGEVDDFWMLVDGDTITAVGSGPADRPTPGTGGLRADEVVDLGGRHLTPGLVDLHTHGGGGFSYDKGASEFAGALATHRAHGTTRSLLSLVANPVPTLRASVAAIAEHTEADPLVLGAHLEGPFLAPDRRGAHHPHYLAPPEKIFVDELLEAGAGAIRMITLAPELPSALPAIDTFVAAGTVVALGHTGADYGLAREAFDHGATVLTHAFNAMPGIHHRDPGPVVAAIDDDRVTIELILDGVHVHPSVARMLFEAARGRVALVTDAMAAAGSDDGDYRLGDLNVTVVRGLAHLTGTPTIAGSTLTQDVALRVAVQRARITPRDAVTALTFTPARALGLDATIGRLAPGYVADAVQWDDDWTVERVWGAGAVL